VTKLGSFFNLNTIFLWVFMGRFVQFIVLEGLNKVSEIDFQNLLTMASEPDPSVDGIRRPSRTSSLTVGTLAITLGILAVILNVILLRIVISEVTSMWDQFDSDVKETRVCSLSFDL